jgi:hypothetical protein
MFNHHHTKMNVKATVTAARVAVNIATAHGNTRTQGDPLDTICITSVITFQLSTRRTLFINYNYICGMNN